MEKRFEVVNEMRQYVAIESNGFGRESAHDFAGLRHRGGIWYNSSVSSGRR